VVDDSANGLWVGELVAREERANIVSAASGGEIGEGESLSRDCPVASEWVPQAAGASNF
jgi:hypothetical protein